MKATYTIVIDRTDHSTTVAECSQGTPHELYLALQEACDKFQASLKLVDRIDYTEQIDMTPFEEL